MPQFIALLQQSSEGCDYTIHCGLEAKRFEAESLIAAVIHVCNKFKDLDDPWSFGEDDIADGKVTVIQVHEERALDMKALAEILAEENAKLDQSMTEAGERAELARLQAKYGAAK